MSLVPANVDQAKVLATLGINVNDPRSQAVLLVCQRYDLDPILKHVVLIQGSVYITRDGFLHIAHQSGVFDGMVTEEEGETESYFWAKVSVFRKDMSRPFTQRARCRKDEKTFADKWDQATTRAERRALKRAFDVAGLPAEGDYEEFDELYDKDTGEALAAPATAPLEVVEAPTIVEVDEPEQPPLPDEPFEDKATQAQRKKLFALLKEAGLEQSEARKQWATDQLGRPIGSYNDLTVDDASTLINLAEQAKK